MSKYLLDTVFVPSRSPTITYVSRPLLETNVDRALLVPGTNLLVYGPSGTGKTTLVENRLKKARIQNYIEVRPPTEFVEETLYRQMLAELGAISPEETRAPETWAKTDKYTLRAEWFARIAKTPMPEQFLNL